MENKKLIIAIVIVLILILGIVGITYLFSSFGKKQMKLLTEESNKILQSDISKDNIDFDIKTEKNYATVEKAIKELRKIYPSETIIAAYKIGCGLAGGNWNIVKEILERYNIAVSKNIIFI